MKAPHKKVQQGVFQSDARRHSASPRTRGTPTGRDNPTPSTPQSDQYTISEVTSASAGKAARPLSALSSMMKLI